MVDHRLNRGGGSGEFMNSRGWAFFVVLFSVALACVGARFGSVTAAPGTEIAAVLAFVGIGVLSEAMALNYRMQTSSPINSSVSHLPLFACAVSFQPMLTLVAAACIPLFSDLIVRRLRLWVAIFNASQYVVSLSAGIVIYEIIGGGSISSGHLSVIGFFAMAITYYCLNTSVVAGFLWIRNALPLGNVLQEMAGPGGGNLLADVLASPLGLFAGWLYLRLGIGGIFAAMLPILLVRYSYLYVIQIRRANSDLINVLIKAIETRDPYTSGHSLRVSTLAKVIAEDLHLPRRKIAKIEQAALLHDIGKIEALYAGIISKPHELSPSERAVIRTHATKGADMLREWSATQDEEVVNGVRHHHERYDGRGYPDGLRGSDIPLAARVIMICDALDAMLSDRPYRPALDSESVRRELVRCSGEQFDPEIVSVVLARGTIERAHELVQQQPPEAMAHPAIVAAASGG